MWQPTFIILHPDCQISEAGADEEWSRLEQATAATLVAANIFAGAAEIEGCAAMRIRTRFDCGNQTRVARSASNARGVASLICAPANPSLKLDAIVSVAALLLECVDRVCPECSAKQRARVL
jgi:hypothetical protein